MHDIIQLWQGKQGSEIHLQATLVYYIPYRGPIITAAARSSASQTDIEELWRKLRPQQTYSLLKQLLDPRGSTDLKSKCYRLGYCREWESRGIFPAQDPK